MDKIEKKSLNLNFRHRDYNNKTVVIGSVIFWVLVIIVIVITVAVLYLKIDPRDLGRANKTWPWQWGHFYMFWSVKLIALERSLQRYKNDKCDWIGQISGTEWNYFKFMTHSWTLPPFTFTTSVVIHRLYYIQLTLKNWFSANTQNVR